MKPSAKRAKEKLDRSIDLAIKASKEFGQSVGPLFEATGDLAAVAIIAAEALDRAANRLTVRLELELAAEMRGHADNLRRTAERARAARG